MRNVKLQPKNTKPKDGASRYNNTNYKEDPAWKVPRLRQEDINIMSGSELKRIKKESYNNMFTGGDSITRDRHSENYDRSTRTYMQKYYELPEMKAKSAKNMRITNSKRITPISVNKNTSRVEYKENTGNPKDQLWKNSSAAMKSKILEAKVQTIYSSSKKNKKK